MKMTDDELKEYKKGERERQRQRWELKRALQREEEELDNRFDRFKPRLREVSSALREILQDVLDEADVRRYEEDPTPDLGRVHDHIEAAIRTLDYYRLLLDHPACLEMQQLYFGISHRRKHGLSIHVTSLPRSRLRQNRRSAFCRVIVHQASWPVSCQYYTAEKRW